MADGALAHDAFDRLAADLRPKLHRYCARMVGSAFEGEDVVQDALAKAYAALAAGARIERPEAWLFRIAHNTALDALRARARHGLEPAIAIAPAPETADVRVAAAASLSMFMHLAPGPRACVILTDVLGHSPHETAEILELTQAAVTAGLHRGRNRLRRLAAESEPAPVVRLDVERLRAYADRFNARDFDALRALLADDVRLDLANRVRLAGRGEVATYFTRYSAADPWRFTVGLAEGRPALLASTPHDPAARPVFVVLLEWRGGEILNIRDFHYARYIMDSLEIGHI